MSYPNSALAVWQLALIAVVAVTTLAVWLGAVYHADKKPGWRSQESQSSAGAGVTAGRQAVSSGTSGGSQGSEDSEGRVAA